ncbi:MAG: hypothetical protein ACK4OM_03425 [Alphaproteobacteria bacterium]
MVKKEEFTSLNLPMMVINISKDNKYQVYSAENEFVTVEAENAAFAIEKSQIEQPYKIIHIINDLIDFIDKSQLIIEPTTIPSKDTSNPSTPDIVN